MPIDDPNTWLQTASAVKTMIDSFRSAIGLAKEANAVGGGSAEQKKAVDTALATASSSASLAEVEIAKALGYPLCKCQFPPTAMLTVGYYERDFYEDGRNAGDPVFGCPKCEFTTAGPFEFKRTDGEIPF
jgi:hypothetical protein